MLQDWLKDAVSLNTPGLVDSPLTQPQDCFSGEPLRYEHVSDALSRFVKTASESRVNYWASYLVDFSCPVLFAYLGVRDRCSWSSFVASALCGLIFFSFIEYAIHRWLLHDPKNPLFLLHDAHHKSPDKPSAFLFPTSICVLLLVWLFSRGVMHVQQASFFIAGFSAGYCYFGLLHHIEHSTRINHLPFRWLQKRWAAHSVHHRLDHRNFGVTTSLWDHIFGTKQGRKLSGQVRS